MSLFGAAQLLTAEATTATVMVAVVVTAAVADGGGSRMDGWMFAFAIVPDCHRQP